MRHTLLELPPKEADAGPSDLSLRARALLHLPTALGYSTRTHTHVHIHMCTIRQRHSDCLFHIL